MLDALSRKTFKHFGLAFEGYSSQHHVGARYVTQQHGPQDYDRSIEFIGAVKTAKGNVATRKRWQRVHRWRKCTGLKDHRCGQVSGFFDELPVQLTGGYPKPVAQIVVHGQQAGGAQIAKPAGLDRGWLAGKSQQTVVRGVTAKVDQNVDAVCPNAPSQRIGIQARYGMPMRKAGAQTLRHGIIINVRVVSMKLQTGQLGKGREQRLQEVGQCVVIKIARDKANLQQAFWIPGVSMRQPACAQGCFKLRPKGQVLGMKFLRRRVNI